MTRKVRRARSDQYAAMRSRGCCACGNMYRTEIHHIKTRGAGGSNHRSNLIPLCSGCHTQEPYAWHRGVKRFLERFPHVLERLIEMGWQMHNGKLIAPPEASSALKAVGRCV